MSDILKNTQVTELIVKQAIFFDYYDGPLSGFCLLDNPRIEFYFDMVSSKEYQDEADDRLYRVYPVQIGTMEMLLDNLSILGEPVGNTWVPIWMYKDKYKLDRLDDMIDKLIEEASPGNIVLLSKDFKTFMGCWEITDPFDSIDDWFTYLNI